MKKQLFALLCFGIFITSRAVTEQEKINKTIQNITQLMQGQVTIAVQFATLREQGRIDEQTFQQQLASTTSIHRDLQKIRSALLLSNKRTLTS